MGLTKLRLAPFVISRKSLLLSDTLHMCAAVVVHAARIDGDMGETVLREKAGSVICAHTNGAEHKVMLAWI